MGKIVVLSPAIANQIAAGEVVERPISVVKELLENAIDAKSTAITVEIKAGGVDYIRVSDNGTGMEKGDCLVAFSRHATSKISAADDLAHIETLGFRGEALSSIAAVAQVKLTTRHKDDDTGTVIEIAGGEVRKNAEIGCPEGTSMEVTNLFFNVPARRKFLKGTRTEGGYVAEYVTRMILARPDISFRYIADGKTQYQSTGDGELKNAIYCIYGADAMKHIMPLLFDDGYIKIDGYIGDVSMARPNRNRQTFILNGRYIKSPLLSSALSKAYDARLMSGKYPFIVAYLSISSYEVDVNVHPNKTEVRFTNERRVYESMMRAASRAISTLEVENIVWGEKERASEDVKIRSSNIEIAEKVRMARIGAQSDLHVQEQSEIAVQKIIEPSIKKEDNPSQRIMPVMEKPAYRDPIFPDLTASVASPPRAREAMNEIEMDVKPIVSIKSSLQRREEEEVEAQREAQMPPESFFEKDATIIAGKVFSGYWIAQRGETMYFIDQHAAHERMLFETMMKTTIASSSQRLFLPTYVTLSPAEEEAYMQCEGVLEDMGFAFQGFNDRVLGIIGVPLALAKADIETLFHDAMGAIMACDDDATKELLKERIIQKACKHAIKASDSLSEVQMEKLIDAFVFDGVTPTCPHGRPVMIRMTKRELEKLFKRIL